MAARFWVTGGTGNWSSTTNWSTASGGASGASVPGTADTATFDASSGAGTATVDSNVTIQTLTMTGFTGTLAFGTNSISLNSTGTVYTGATTFTVTGTPVINVTSTGSTSITVNTTATTEANSISFNFTGGTYALSLTGTTSFRNLDFTGYAGTVGNSAISIYGNLTVSTGMSLTAGTNAWTFGATSGTKTITSNGKTIDFPLTFNGAGGAFQLQDALTLGSTRTLTLTAGTLDLNSKTLTTGLFSSNVSSTRSVAFGTGKIVLISSGTVFAVTTTTGWSVTGTPVVDVNNNTATATTINLGVSAGETNSVSFNILSGTYTLTFLSGCSIRNLDYTGFSGTQANGTVNIYGNLTVSTGMSFTAGTNAWTFGATSGTKTITSNGKSLDFPLTFNGVGGVWTLGSAFTTSNTITLTNGTLDTSSSGNYSISANQINTGSGTKTFNCNGSSISIGSTTAWPNANPTGFTFNAGTSTFTFSATTPTFSANSVTFYNVTFSSAPTATFNGSYTFNNLTVPSSSVSGVNSFTLAANQTVNGTFTASANTGNGVGASRLQVKSDTLGTARTITAAAVSLSDVDFQDITGAGTATWSGTRIGNAGGNTNITFTAAKTVYYSAATAGNFSVGSNWATSSGGGGSGVNFPLPQDTAVIDNSSGTGTFTVNTPYFYPSLDFSSRSTSLTFAVTGAYTLIGNVTLSSSITVSGTVAITLGSRGTQTITSAGRTWTTPFIVNSVSGTARLLDALTGSSTLNVTSGTLDLNTYGWTCTTFNSSNSNTRTLAFGTTGSITTTTTSGTLATVATSTNLTVTGTPKITINNNTANGSTVAGGGTGATEANSVSFYIINGTYDLTITGSVRTLDLTGFAGTIQNNNVLTIYGDCTISSGMTLSSGSLAFTMASTSATVRTFTTNGKTIGIPWIFNGVGGSFKLGDNLTMSAPLTQTNGALDLNGKTLSSSSTYTIGTGTQSITFNGGTISLTGSGTVFNVTSVALTTSAGTGAGTITLTSASAKTFAGGGVVYYATINQGGAGALSITGSNTFDNITATYTAAGYTVNFGSGSTNTFGLFSINGSSGKVLTLGATTAGASASVSYTGGGNLVLDYLSMRDIVCLPASNGSTPISWYAGTNSTNLGNNSNVLFNTTAYKAYMLTSGTTWTVPTDWNSSSNNVYLFGAGGGGGGSTVNGTARASGGGGGGGAYRGVTNYSATPGGSVSYAIGAAGTAGAAGGTTSTGGTGGTTTFDTYSAGGGTGGASTSSTSTGGTGGTSSGGNAGGNGGTGNTGTSTTTGRGGGGGGGAGGPNGTGKTGGNGFAGTTTTNAGGGGGGYGGGTAGGNASGTAGGTGGNNFSGTGGGASATSGTVGGGGGGGRGASDAGGGGGGIDLFGTTGGGGGMGGGGYTANYPSPPAFGAGGAGAYLPTGTGTTGFAGGAGGQGAIFIVYTPSATVSNSNFFLLF